MEVPVIVSAQAVWVSESEIQVQITFDQNKTELIEDNVVPLTMTLPPPPGFFPPQPYPPEPPWDPDFDTYAGPDQLGE